MAKRFFEKLSFKFNIDNSLESNILNNISDDIKEHNQKCHNYFDYNLVYVNYHSLDLNFNLILKIIIKIITECNFPVLIATTPKMFIDFYQFYQSKIRIIWIDQDDIDQIFNDLSFKFISDDNKIVIINSVLITEPTRKELMDILSSEIYQIINNEFYDGTQQLHDNF